MNRRTWKTLTKGATVATLAMTVTIGTSSAMTAYGDSSSRGESRGAVEDPTGGAGPGDKHRIDDFAHPLGNKQRELRKKAVAKMLDGDAKVVEKNGSRSIKVGKEHVQYDPERTASVFTILTDFGEKSKGDLGDAPGPVHNEIPEPDRDWDGNSTDNNSTYWTEDFDREHYTDMLFGKKNSFKDFYAKQSQGRFEVTGDVSNWVTVPYNEARYGSNDNPDGEADGYWNYVKDTVNAWYKDQKSRGKTDAEIKKYLKKFDVWDRYDHDGDGNFDEPDGYIDHFQAIHAGEGEEAGGGEQGEDAIWSHRWYAFATDQGQTGPDGNQLGGTEIGDSGIWVGDYTTEPENGGLGVFAHEFGHDLGLPDLYDTVGGNDNSTGFWTLMSSGSWLGMGKDSIGTKPGYMGAWEKLQLGWLDHTTVDYGKSTKLTVDRAELASPDAGKQAVVVNLPNKEVTTDYNKPKSGTYEWWSGSGNGLNNTLTRSVDLTGASSAKLDVAAYYDIETEYDNMYLEVSEDGETWTRVGDPITGSTEGAWKDLSFDLSEFAGKKVDVRFRYQTDGGLALDGGFLDDFTVTADGKEVFTDDVEQGKNGWTADGFTRMTGSVTKSVPRYYLAENRTYTGYDKTLKHGPYNFGWAETKPDWVEHFPYQNGLLITYANGEFEDNNTSEHPGQGQVLAVDARPKPLTMSSGAQLRNRLQLFDATFGLEPTDEVVFHDNGLAKLVRERAAKPRFNDSDPDRYFSEDNPEGTTKVAGSGTKITVLRSLDGGDRLQLKVSFKR